MNRYLIQIFWIVIMLVLFVVDKAWSGVFSLFDYISLSILFLVFLANLRTRESFIVPFFVFAIVSDWYNKVFIGSGAVVVIVSLYLFNIFRIRFINNKPALTILNLIFIWILLLVINGLENIFSLNYVIGAVVSSLLISPIFFRE